MLASATATPAATITVKLKFKSAIHEIALALDACTPADFRAEVQRRTGVLAARQKLVLERGVVVRDFLPLREQGFRNGLRITLFEADNAAAHASSVQAPGASSSRSLSALAAARPRTSFGTVMQRIRDRKAARGTRRSIILDTDMIECSQINLLPEELLLYIFSFVPAFSLVRSSRVCKLWYLVLLDESLWRSMYTNTWSVFTPPPPDASWKREYFDKYFADVNISEGAFRRDNISSIRGGVTSMFLEWPYLTAACGASVFVVHCETHQRVRELKAHRHRITAMTHRGDVLLTGEETGTLMLWDLSKDRCALPWSKHSNELAGSFEMFTHASEPHDEAYTVLSLLLDPDITMLVAGSSVGRVKALDLRSGTVTFNMASAHAGQVFSMYMTESGNILTAGTEGVVAVRDPRVGLTTPVQRYTVTPAVPFACMRVRENMHTVMVGTTQSVLEFDMRMAVAERTINAVASAVYFDDKKVLFGANSLNYAPFDTLVPADPSRVQFFRQADYLQYISGIECTNTHMVVGTLGGGAWTFSFKGRELFEEKRRRETPAHTPPTFVDDEPPSAAAPVAAAVPGGPPFAGPWGGAPDDDDMDG